MSKKALSAENHARMDAPAPTASRPKTAHPAATDFQPWCQDFILGTLLSKFQRWPWLVGLLAFAVYWGLPLTLCSFSTAKHTASVSDIIGYGVFDPRISGLLYLRDLTHYSFSIVVFFGALVGPAVLWKIHAVASQLQKRGVLARNETRNQRIYEFFQRWSNSFVLKIVSAVLGVACSRYFYQLTHTNTDVLRQWWGHSAYGHSGVLFSVVIFLMVYGGTQVMFHTSIASIMFMRLLRRRIRPQPFHKDGCNGFSPLGWFIFFQWVLASLLAAAIFVVIHVGYLGVEKFYFVWVLAFVGILTIPFIAIVPLFAYLRASYRARQIKLRKLQRLLHTFVCKVEARCKTNENSAAETLVAIKSMGEIKRAHEVLDKMNIWPFNIQALSVIVCVYAFQASMILHQIWRLLLTAK